METTNSVTTRAVLQRIRRDLRKYNKTLIVGRDVNYTSFIVDENNSSDPIGNVYDYAKANGYIKESEELIHSTN